MRRGLRRRNRAGETAGADQDPGRTAGAKCLGLPTSFPASALLAAGADWTAPDLAGVPREVLYANR